MIWLLRALLAAAVLLSVLITAPAPGLDERLWLGGQTVASRAVSTGLGSEAFSAPGSPTGAFGWLSDALQAFLVRHAGFAALQLLTAAALLGALALVEARARRKASAPYAFGAALLAAATMLGNLRSGGGALEWLAAAAFVLAVDGSSRRAAVAAVVLAIVWCNASATGFFAPWIALAYALCAPRALAPWLVFGGCVAATLATPAGFEFAALAPAALHLSGAPAVPIAVAPLAYRTGFALGLVLLTFLGLRGSPPAETLSCLGALVVALMDGHQLPLFGIVAAPVVAAAAQRAYPVALSAPLGAVAAALAVLLGAGGWFSAKASASDVPPNQLVARLRSDGREHRLLCTRLDWCGTALASGDSHLRVFMDQREPAYPPSVRDDQHAMATAGAHWRTALKRARVDAIVVDRHATLAGLLEVSQGWVRAGEQEPVRLYLRAAAP